MSNRPTVATSSWSFNAWTGPVWAAAAAAGARRRAVSGELLLAYVDPMYSRVPGKKGGVIPTTIDPPLPPPMREASSVIFMLFCFLTDKRNKISTTEKFLHRDS